MSASLEDYQQVVGSEVIDELRLLAGRVKHRRLQHINSTAVGGGVAELLTRLVPLFRALGIDTTWDVIKGDQAFFEVTKAFHNALHGGDETITEEMFEVYRETTNMTCTTWAAPGTWSWCTTPSRPRSSLERKKRAGTGFGDVTSTSRRHTRRCGVSSNPTSSATTLRSSRCPSFHGSSRSPNSWCHRQSIL